MTLFDVQASADTSLEPSLISTSSEVEVLREQVDILQEQINSLHQLIKELNSELFDKQQQIEILEQELVQTNQELCHALTPLHYEIHKVNQLTQPSSVNESLAKPLNPIYNYSIPTQKLKVEAVTVNVATLPYLVAEIILNNSKELRTRSQQLGSQFKELGFQFIANKAYFLNLQEETAWKSTELPQQLENETSISQRSQVDRTRLKANVTLLQDKLERAKKLLDESQIWIKSSKSQLTSLFNSKKSAKGNVSLAYIAF